MNYKTIKPKEFIMLIAYENDDDNSIWSNLSNDSKFVSFVANCKKEKLIEYHRDFNITILQFLLWYIGSGIRSFQRKKNDIFSRKDWAFHKLKLLKNNVSSESWNELVHTPTGFDKKCSTVHFFARNGYTIEMDHLDKINNWLDEVNGRFKYTNKLDEYRYKPGDYVQMHRDRQKIFRNKVKKDVDILKKKYHTIEINLCKIWESGKKYLKTDADNFYEWLKEVSTNDEKTIYTLPEIMRKGLFEAGKARYESHKYHTKIFKNDKLSIIEKKEEEKGRGLSQNTNHLWIINTFKLLLSGTKEGHYLNIYLKSN